MGTMISTPKHINVQIRVGGIRCRLTSIEVPIGKSRGRITVTAVKHKPSRTQYALMLKHFVNRVVIRACILFPVDPGKGEGMRYFITALKVTGEAPTPALIECELMSATEWGA